MSWTELTVQNRFLIHHAATILRHHHKTRPLLRRAYCSCCGERWGAWGCDDRVWAIDYLNSLSGLLIDDKPAPLHPHCGRRAPKFREKINRAAVRAKAALHHRWRHDRHASAPRRPPIQADVTFSAAAQGHPRGHPSRATCRGPIGSAKGVTETAPRRS